MQGTANRRLEAATRPSTIVLDKMRQNVKSLTARAVGKLWIAQTDYCATGIIDERQDCVLSLPHSIVSIEAK